MRRNRYWTAQALMSPRPAAGDHSARPEVTVGRPGMKEFYCGAIIHGCETRIVAASEEDLIQSIDTHARVDHGMTEVPEAMLDEARREFHDVEPADARD